MDIDAQEQVKWHFSTLPPKTKKALDFLATQKWLEKSDWHLAGGAVLALQTGHRKSVDLEFLPASRQEFTQKPEINFKANWSEVKKIFQKEARKLIVS